MKKKKNEKETVEVKNFVSPPLKMAVLSPEKAEEIFSKFKIIKKIQPRKKEK